MDLEKMWFKTEDYPAPENKHATINSAWWFNYELMKGLGCLCPMWFLDKCVKGER